MCAHGVNFVMADTAYLECKKCGTHIPIDNVSIERRDDEGVVFVRYDPACTKVVLINAESGVRHIVNLSSREQQARPASRQIAGIIGPY